MENSCCTGDNPVKGSDKDCAGDDADIDTCDVVLRRPRIVADDTEGGTKTTEDGKKGDKKVKWSECTELREKMKVCRRSQLDIPLDYHHIAVDEEIEKEGVKHWRQHVKKGEGGSISPLAAGSGNSKDNTATKSKNKECNDNASDDNSSDDGDYDPCCVEDIDRKLHAINIKSTKHTMYPAYCAAIPVFEEWLSSCVNTKEISEEEKTVMESQLELYKRIVEIYEKSFDTDDPSVIEAEFAKITSYLQQVQSLGSLPSCVPVAISQVLNVDEDLIQSTDL